MDEIQLKKEGIYSIYSQVGARTEIPGCSLCMGNQARVQPGATIISTSTRNFDDRMGDGARVYLGSAELAAVAALKGEAPVAGGIFRGHEGESPSLRRRTSIAISNSTR